MSAELEQRLAEIEKELATARQQSAPHSNPTKRNSGLKKSAAIVVAFAVTAVISAGAVFVVQHNEPTSKELQSIQSRLAETQKTTNYPLYYPTSLPEGFQLDTSTIQSQKAFVSFAVSAPSGSRLLVTQQVRPTVMERVKILGQDGKVDLKNGRHIADLEGRYTGMIVSDKTLVIINGAEKNDLNYLKQLLDAFKEL